jgi:hypothetical protein
MSVNDACGGPEAINSLSLVDPAGRQLGTAVVFRSYGSALLHVTAVLEVADGAVVLYTPSGEGDQGTEHAHEAPGGSRFRRVESRVMMQE